MFLLFCVKLIKSCKMKIFHLWSWFKIDTVPCLLNIYLVCRILLSLKTNTETWKKQKDWMVTVDQKLSPRKVSREEWVRQKTFSIIHFLSLELLLPLYHHDCVLLRTGWLVTRASTVTTNILLSFPLVYSYLHEDKISVDKVYFYWEGIFWKWVVYRQIQLE